MKNLIWKMIAILFLVGLQEVNGQHENKFSNPANKFEPIEFVQHKSEFNSELLDNNYNVLVELEGVPSKATNAILDRHNIRLKFRSGNTYQAIIPSSVPAETLDQIGVISIRKNDVEDKISSFIKNNNYPSWAVKQQNTVDVAIILNENSSEHTIQKLILSYSLTHLQKPLKGGYLLRGRIAQDKVLDLAESPAVEYVDVVEQPVEHLNHENSVLQRVNVLSASFAGQRGLTGEGVCVGVGDGGQLGNHLDFDGRVINYANGTYSSFGSHGDHVAGTIGGAGIVDPVHRGLAPSSTLVIEKTTSIITNTANYYADHDMVFTNNSWGVGYDCGNNGTYNYSSQNLDWQSREFPNLLHVFAAGNSGYSTCGSYPAGYGSVLKFYQSAKNVLTVGNALDDRTLNGGSSKGPVSDGRLKPEIVGIGSYVTSTGRNYDYYSGSGTSMSAPSVTATLALLNEQYRNINSGEKPEGALLKAVACNTADDAGNVGPDYAYGFGVINAKRAVEAIENVQYKNAAISDSENYTTSLNIPAGLGQVKVMLYWHDKESPAYPAKALINDLDITLTAPNGTVYNPWVLNHDSMFVTDLPTRAIDTLNNIEQITLDNPVAGTYTVKVNGSLIPEGPQSFYIIWDFVNPEVELTFPYGGEKFEPGSVQLIQWDVDANNTNNFTIEYSVNGGANWNTIDNNVEAGLRHYSWNVPNVTTKDAFVRISKNGTSETSVNVQPFIIFERPSNLASETLCEGYVELTWDAVADAVGYEVFKYDGLEMQSVATVSMNSYVTDPLPVGDDFWFGITSINTDGISSQRSIATKVIAESGGSCPWDYDISLRGIEINSVGRAHTSYALTDNEVIALDIKNLGINSVDTFEIEYQIDGGNIVEQEFVETLLSGDQVVKSFSSTADFSAVGNYQLDTWINISQDVNTSNNELVGQTTVRHLANDPIVLPFTEDFESATLISYEIERMGLVGLNQWDFMPDATGEVSCVTVNGNKCLESGSFSNTSISTEEGITMTLNLSYYNIDDDVTLEFDYQYVFPNPVIGGDTIFIRGSDLDEWVQAEILSPLGGWKTTDAIDVSALLGAEGQDLTTSFQVHFSQGKNTGYALDNIVMQAAGALPIELMEFNAERKDNNALLTWTTTSEVDNAYFDIEFTREPNTLDDENFEFLKRINGNGNTNEVSNYSFLDDISIKNGVHYYRLKQVNFDGTFEYSGVRAVKFDERKEVLIYPNPFTDKLNILNQNTSEGINKIELIDTNGRVILEREIENASSENILLDLNNSLPEGTYILRLISNNKTTSYPLMKASQ